MFAAARATTLDGTPSIDARKERSMRHLNRLAVAGVAAFAITVGSWALAVPASASAGASPLPTMVMTMSPQEYVATLASDDVTGQASKKKKKDPCVAGAALDSETGKWRATVSCDDWTAVFPGSYDTRDAALDESEGWVRGVNKFVDGPGCDEPFVLC
jgi:hypothetical protein